MTTLERMPGRIDRLGSQILQLREEIRNEFSAVRREMVAGDEQVIAVLSERIENARRETRVLHEDAIGRIAVIGEGLETLARKVDRLDITLSQTVGRVETLSQTLDRVETTLSHRIDGTDAKLDLILARLDTPPDKRKRAARS